MSDLSIPPPEAPEAPEAPAHAGLSRDWGMWLVRVIAPCVVAAALIAVVLAAGGTAVDHDLQLVAPVHARPGAPVAVRGLLLTGIRPPATPRPRETPVDVALIDDGGRVLARAELRPASVLGSEGGLQVPEDATGPLFLRGVAPLDEDREARVVRRIRVSERPPPAERRGRLATSHQRFEPDVLTGTSPPEPFDVRVVGGACVPEHRCVLSVWVGEPPAAVELEAPPNVERLSVSPAGETSGPVQIALVVRGPEALVSLVARRGGAEVGRRGLRLPLALGAVAARVERPFVPMGERARLVVEQLDDPEALVVDAYRDGVWHHTASVAAEDVGDGFEVPFDLEPGLWRLQVREDAFSSDHAATALVRVAVAGGLADPESWRGVELETADPLAAPLRSAGSQAALRHRHALDEIELRVLPRAVQGSVQQNLRLTGRVSPVRWGAAIAILVFGVLAAVVLYRRGQRAAREARMLLAAAGVQDAHDPARARRATLAVGLSALVLVLAFATAALWALTRGG